MIELDEVKNKKANIIKDNPYSQDKAVSSLKATVIDNIIKVDDIEEAKLGKVTTYATKSALDGVEKAAKAKNFGKEKTFVFGDHTKDISGNSQIRYQAANSTTTISPTGEAEITVSSTDKVESTKVNLIKDYLDSVSQATKRKMITNALSYEHDVIEKVTHTNDKSHKKTPECGR